MPFRVLRSTLVVVALVAWGRDGRAWGALGHRCATIVAEARLTPTARRRISALLEPDETLAAASIWADEHRRDIPGSGAWHYVNIPLVEAHYDARFCAPTGCVVSKIEELRKTLANDAASRAERGQALRLFVHFVEDLHQPLHVGDNGDRGGNDLQIQFLGRGTNLHHLWDQDLLEQPGTDEAACVKELERLAKADAAAGWAKGTVESWADESLAAAREAYSVPGSSSLLMPGARLGQAYVDVELPVAKRRLAQAAVRLSSMLNDVFAYSIRTSKPTPAP